MDTKTDQRVYKRLARIGFFCILLGVGGCFGQSVGVCATNEMEWDVLQVHMEPYFNDVVDAIYIAEGGKRAVKPYGILSVSCSGESDCRRIAYNTVRNNYRRWIQGGRVGEYLAFLGNRYAPTSGSTLSYAERKLNKNWTQNVRYYLEKD